MLRCHLNVAQRVKEGSDRGSKSEEELTARRVSVSISTFLTVVSICTFVPEGEERLNARRVSVSICTGIPVKKVLVHQ